MPDAARQDRCERVVVCVWEMIGPLLIAGDTLEGEPFSTPPKNFAWSLPTGPGWGVTLKPEYREEATMVASTAA